MARLFNGTSDRLDWANVTNLQNQAFSISCWVNCSTLGDKFRRIIAFCDTANDVRMYLSTRTTRTLEFHIVGVSDLRLIPNLISLVSSGWQHIILTFAGNISDVSGAHIYIGGTEPSYYYSISGSTAPSMAGLWCVGGDYKTDSVNHSGSIADLGVWNRVVTSDEIVGLASGLSPQFYKNGLLFAPPLLGYPAEIDPISGLVATHDGTTVADHPRIYYPSSMMGVYTPSTPGGSTITMAVLAHYYQQMRAR